jgi:hypothetical protein
LAKKSMPLGKNHREAARPFIDVIVLGVWGVWWLIVGASMWSCCD